jgi:2,3-diketo-5-methylthio-1-phosphopentane phosphatase
VLAGARELAVFCDFDGTFLLQDVGSTLAKTHIPGRRDRLWARYQSGELDAWGFTSLLLDGFELPESVLDAFLESVELDPGSRALVTWCEDRGVRFEVLSDGFDRNLEMLQRLNEVRFEYRANHLRYEAGRWRIRPGNPSETCGCGTGTCKGTIIGEYRALHPNALCVHIGNGRVSDLCGARAADLTFARRGPDDTLGPALEECGEAFCWFDSLNDVVAALEAVRGGRPIGSG